MPVIEVQHVSYYYSEGTPFQITGIDDLNISIEKNQIIGVIGHTGSGKSTFAQLLNGLIKPSKGKILLNGKDIWKDFPNIRDVHFKIGLTFQYPEYQLFEETVYKDIAFGPCNQGLAPEEIDIRVKNAIKFVGLNEEFLGKSPFNLSGGEKRRVAIAGIIAMQPEIIILDEPTAGLDPKSKEEVLNSICYYHQKTKNITIFISHVMEDIAKICDKVLVFNQGKVVMFDTTETVFLKQEILNSIGLDIPQITKIMNNIHKKGFGKEKCILSVDKAVDDILHILSEKR